MRTATFLDSLLFCGLAETTMEKHGEASAERMTLGKDDGLLNMCIMDMITSIKSDPTPWERQEYSGTGLGRLVSLFATLNAAAAVGLQ